MRGKLNVSAVALMGVLAAPAWAANPFATPSSLPYQAPRFDIIKDSDYQPGFEAGMKEQIAEIRQIAENPAAPTFDNTIAAMERSGRMLDRVNNTFFGVVQANTNPTLDKVQTVEAPRLAAHSDAIFLNPKLFARVKTLYDARAGLKLDAEALQVLTLYYRQFVHAGALLSDKDKTRLQAINKEDASLETQFQQKLVAAAKAGALVLDNKAELAGLSGGEVASTVEAAYVLDDQMADTPDKVEKFLGQLVAPTRAKAADEAKLIQAAIDKDGKHFDLKPWDWQRYADQVQKERYDLDQNALKPYFEIHKVLADGVFYAANKLYGLTFKERHDLPTWNPDMLSYEVFDADG